MGSTLSVRQTELLINHFDRALLMLDGDEAGRHGAATIARVLGTRMPLGVISLDDGAQPD